jgi:hypothetical protein
MQAKVAPQAEENLLGMPPVGDSWIPDGPKEKGVMVIPEADELFLRERATGGQEALSATGKDRPGQASTPGLGPFEERDGLSHHFGPNTIAWNHCDL